MARRDEARSCARRGSIDRLYDVGAGALSDEQHGGLAVGIPSCARPAPNRSRAQSRRGWRAVHVVMTAGRSRPRCAPGPQRRAASSGRRPPARPWAGWRCSRRRPRARSPARGPWRRALGIDSDAHRGQRAAADVPCPRRHLVQPWASTVDAASYIWPRVSVSGSARDHVARRPGCLAVARLLPATRRRERRVDAGLHARAAPRCRVEVDCIVMRVLPIDGSR